LSPAASSPNIFRRWLDAFVVLPDRIKLPLALLIAVLLHGVGFLVAWVWPFVTRFIMHYLAMILPIAPAQATPTPPPKKLEVTIFTPTPPPKIVATPTPAKLPENDEQLLKELFAQLPPEKQREYIDVEGLAKKKNTSKQALLESWRDSVAGSRKRGTGDEPLPTLDGLDNMPFTQLTNKEVNLGKVDEPAEPPPSTASPIFKPKPVNPNAQASNTTPETAATPTPTPPPMLMAKATPPPSILTVPEANPEQIPMFLNRRSDPNAPKFLTTKPSEPEPKPTPAPTATPPPKPTPVSTAQPTPSQLPTPTPPDAAPKAPSRPLSVIEAKLETKPLQPKPVPNPGYSPQMRRTKVNGAAMPAGDDGVDSVATPLGRYKKAVSAAVGSRWNYYIQQRMSLLQTGKVTAVFSLDARGKVRSFRIEENTSNRAHAALIEQCVREAEFDPPPPEALRNGVFEYPMSFHLL
jgi:outer membrane biosynthesis protein TonB